MKPAESTQGLFTIASNGKTYTVDFGLATGTPSCSCHDWLNWHVPCKHFFAVFRLSTNWSWGNLPTTYLASEYIISDLGAVDSGLDSILGHDSPGIPLTDTYDTSAGTNQMPGEDASQELHESLPRNTIYIYVYSHIGVCQCMCICCISICTGVLIYGFSI